MMLLADAVLRGLDTVTSELVSNLKFGARGDGIEQVSRLLRLLLEDVHIPQ